MNKLMETQKIWGIEFLCVGYIEDPVSTKTVYVSLTDPTSTVGLHLLYRLLMLRCVEDGVTTMKPGHQTTGNARVVWPDESSFTLFPTSGRVCVWRTPKETYNPECLAPTVKHGGRFSEGLGSNIVVFCWSHYPSWPNNCKGVRGQVAQSGASHDPDVIS
jgi:hypothetical protein